ncbi:MAG: hypothetical protein ACWA5U_11540 [bacterium]
MLTGIKQRLIESCRIKLSLTAQIRTAINIIKDIKGSGYPLAHALNTQFALLMSVGSVLYVLLTPMTVTYAAIFSTLEPSLSPATHASDATQATTTQATHSAIPVIPSDSQQSVQQLLGSTPYGWFNLIQEKPDFSENWETFDESQLQGQLSDNVHVHYNPHHQMPSADTAVLSDLLQTQPYAFNKDNQVLTLKQQTIFEFPKGASYIGVHYLREVPHREPLVFIVTTADGQQKQFTSCTKSDELDKFSGFLGSGEVITRLEIRKPPQSSYVIGDVLWGHKQNLHQQKQCETTLMPVVTNMECAEQGWLFDIEVSAMQSRDDSWWCVNDDEKQCGIYGEIASFGYYSKTDKPSVALTFADQKNKQCAHSLVVDLPEKCSENCNYVQRDEAFVPVCPDHKAALLVQNQ